MTDQPGPKGPLERLPLVVTAVLVVFAVVGAVAIGAQLRRIADTPPGASATAPASGITLNSASPDATGSSSAPAASVEPARWVAAGDLRYGRSRTHVFGLPDGRAFVVGQDNVCTPGGAWPDSRRTEVGQPDASTWTGSDPLETPRDGPAAVQLVDGRVLVAGGLNEDEVPKSSVRTWDPEKGKWADAALMSVARHMPVGVALADGRVLVAGGEGVRGPLRTAETYEPRADRWTATGSMRQARPELGKPTNPPEAVRLTDGRVLVVDARGEATSGFELPVVAAEIYDPATGRWSGAGSLTVPRRPDFGLVPLSDGGALVIGGTGADDRPGSNLPGDRPPSLSSVERFDPASLTWHGVGDLTVGRDQATVAALDDGRVLVAGGAGADGILSSVEIFDPASDRFVAGEPLPGPRESGASARLADGSILVVGGDIGHLNPEDVPSCPEPVRAAVRYVPGGTR